MRVSPSMKSPLFMITTVSMPYRRIVVLHLTIIFGGFATLAFGKFRNTLTLLSGSPRTQIHLQAKHLRSRGCCPSSHTVCNIYGYG